jgi:hypothetical protein
MRSRCCIWSKAQTGSDHHFANQSRPAVALSLWLAERLFLVIFIVVQRLMLRLLHACHHPAILGSGASRPADGALVSPMLWGRQRASMHEH